MNDNTQHVEHAVHTAVASGQTAEASKLAIEEAASRVNEFSLHDLNQATEDIKDLEAMFLETIGSVARESNATFFEIAADFIAHARSSGTLVGRQTQSVMQSLNHIVANWTGNDNVQHHRYKFLTGAHCQWFFSGYHGKPASGKT